jgi:hypothetical protein
MYKIYFINFQYYSNKTADSLAEAIKIGKEAGFEFAVHFNNEIVAAWSVFGGTQYYR